MLGAATARAGFSQLLWDMQSFLDVRHLPLRRKGFAAEATLHQRQPDAEFLHDAHAARVFAGEGAGGADLDAGAAADALLGPRSERRRNDSLRAAVGEAYRVSTYRLGADSNAEPAKDAAVEP